MSNLIVETLADGGSCWRRAGSLSGLGFKWRSQRCPELHSWRNRHSLTHVRHTVGHNAHTTAPYIWMGSLCYACCMLMHTLGWHVAQGPERWRYCMYPSSNADIIIKTDLSLRCVAMLAAFTPKPTPSCTTVVGPLLLLCGFPRLL